MRFSSNAQSNPWLTSARHSSLVSLGTHSLYASISGPLRSSSSPLLIFITGAGGPSAIHMKLQEQLSPFVRCLFYDRAGYDRSTLPALDETKDKILADDTARDLTKLLKVTNLEPPYLLVAHSFGGIIARTFLQHHNTTNSTITGMLLFDTATEIMLSPLFPRFPPDEIWSVAKNVDIPALTHLQRDSGLSDEEWDYAMAATQRCAHALSLEDTHESARRLSLHRQLDYAVFGNRPLTVVRCNIARDMQVLYDEGVKTGGGTGEEMKVCKMFIEKCRCLLGQIQRAQCDLGSNVVLRNFEQWGHDLPIRSPTIVVDMVRELMGRMENENVAVAM